jgi:hypothetical protein
MKDLNRKFYESRQAEAMFFHVDGQDALSSSFVRIHGCTQQAVIKKE